MELPFFYISAYEPGMKEILLDEDNSRHVIQVLRMQVGERLRLTDGRGHSIDARILDPHKKKCRVGVDEMKVIPPRENRVTVAISLVKNASRFEWFVEKATEMGLYRVIPLLCERTERQHFRLDRMQQIMVSAMLQSQQCWLPEIREPQAMEKLLQDGLEGLDLKLIAHCEEDQRSSLAELIRAQPGMGGAGLGDSIILIGPEGDFTPKEIDASIALGFMPVMLGATRLRTETAGVVAAALLCIV